MEHDLTIDGHRDRRPRPHAVARNRRLLTRRSDPGRRPQSAWKEPGRGGVFWWTSFSRPPKSERQEHRAGSESTNKRTGITMRTRIKNVRLALPALLAVGAIAATVAGCGGSGYRAVGSGASHPTTSSATHQTAPSAPAAASASAGIPQHNGGDMDLDNNGGPSDGDGNQ
jgi:hypothetical protein